jgi:hypothetical protein
VKILLRKRRRGIAAEVHARLGGEGIVVADESANFFGVQSRGKAQIRGNGHLAATSHQILFIMWLPRRELTIARDRVSAVERTRSHLGKTIGRELLRVRFTNDAGRPDSVAWFVRDLAAWESALGAWGGAGRSGLPRREP